MKTLLRILTNRWLLSVLALLFIACVIWLIGPLIGFGNSTPLASPMARIILIMLIVLLWAIKKIIGLVRANKAEKDMVEGIVQPAAETEPDASAEELEVLKGRFEEAVSVLKKSKGGRRTSLYQLPWYIIIGPPGSGKTTALLNSGLNFPLADRFGQEAVQGIGGTRNCDWWFTDQAVMIDTAGRYVTQDSHAEVDSTAWNGFLDLLKKYRKRRPINGIFIAISLSDLMTQSESERRQNVLAIRKRMEELEEHFGMRFPIYVMLTKCDLVAGFSEYFENLGRADREQVWGMTFPLQDRSTDSTPVDAFGSEFDALVRRLNERLVWRLSQERDVTRKAMIYRFPTQMASLKDTLSGFLGEVFQASRFNEAPMVRGVYFCSGTQEGTPVDRVLGALARTFSIAPQAVGGNQGHGKSFFIANMLKKVAFPEAELAGTNRKLEVQRAWLQRAAYASVGLLAILAVVLWSISYSNNKAYIAAVAEKVVEADAQIGNVAPENLDPLEAVPALDGLRILAQREDNEDIEVSAMQGFGLSQEPKLSNIGDEAYRRVLRTAFLPRIMLRMEDQMQRGGPTADYAYAALRAYLSLDSREHYDADMINAFLRVDWLENTRRELSTAQRDNVENHLAAMLEERPVPLPLTMDEDLIRVTQADLRRMPLDERIYGRLLRQDFSDLDLGPGFNIREAGGGAAADLVFVRRSGAALAKPLSPLFTKEGYLQVFKSTSKDLTRELLRETWVLGQEEEINERDLDDLMAKVEARYLEDFAKRYTNLILDIDLAPFSTPDEAARIFRILSRDDSPILLILQEIERQTALEEVDEDSPLNRRARDRIENAERRVRDLIISNTPGARRALNAANRAGNLVDVRFGDLHDLVRENEGQVRPVDHLLALIERLFQFMSTVASEQAAGAVPPHVVAQGQALIQEIRMEAANQPNMVVGNILNAAASRSSELAFGGVRAHLNSLWRSGPLAFCENAIESRYPINRNGSSVIRIDDFGRFFGYGQMMETFFREHLSQYVDTSSTPWRIRRAESTPIQLSTAALRAFERADAIKRTFFGFNSSQPLVGFTLKPLDMDANIGRFVLNLEGKEVSWDHGPQISSTMQWPGPRAGTEVRIETQQIGSGRTSMLRQQGPWAWFRILDNAQMRATDRNEHFEIEFDVEGQKITYELVATSAYNPFRFDDLERFTCPKEL